MAVQLEFFNIIVPLENICRVAEALENIRFPNLRRNVVAALADEGPQVRDPSWHDGALFRHGAMGWEGIADSLEDWERCGLVLHEEVDGRMRWKDLCVALSGEGVVQHPCDWATYDKATNSICLNDLPGTAVVGPQLSRGIECYDERRHEDALKYLRPLAEAGEAVAQRYLAQMYVRGEGVERDLDQAAAWLGRAADGGDPDARYALGRVHETGTMYQDGHGIARDPVKAYRWYKSLRDSGAHRRFVEGIDLEALVVPALAAANEAHAARNFGEASKRYEPLAEAGCLEAQLRMAEIHGQGLGVPRNPHYAMTWLSDAASRNDDAGATLALGELYDTGLLYGAPTGVQRSEEKAWKWYRLAAEKGDKAAKARAHALRPRVVREDLYGIANPAGQRRIECGREFTADQWAMMQRGWYAESTQEKRHILVEGMRLLVMSSWTGLLYFDAQFEARNGGVRLAQVLVPSDSREADDDLLKQLYGLIDDLLLGNDEGEPRSQRPAA